MRAVPSPSWLLPLAACIALVGCGQRGPLFLPEPPPAEPPAGDVQEEDEDGRDASDEPR